MRRYLPHVLAGFLLAFVIGTVFAAPRRSEVHGPGPLLIHNATDLTGKSADTDLITDFSPTYDGSTLIIKIVPDESSVFNIVEDGEVQGLNSSTSIDASDVTMLSYGPVYSSRTYNFQLETLTGGTVSRLDVAEVVREQRY